MKNKDLSKLIQGMIAVVVGVLIAVLGIGAVMNTYLAIVCLVTGSILVLLTGYVVFNKGPLPLGSLILGGVLISIGVGVFTNFVDFNMLINIIVISLFGVGGALVIFGCYICAKTNLPVGVSFILVGGGLIAMAACYIAFPDFQKVFWIIVGILIAVYGGLNIILAVTEKKK